jgi:hypothetical protein
MDPKEFYSLKENLIMQLADALMAANELSMKIRGLEVRGAAEPDPELLYELRTLSSRLEAAKEYAADQVSSLESFTS